MSNVSVQQLRANLRWEIDAIRAGRIGKVGDTVYGCGLSKVWMLPPTHPWTKTLCIPHDLIFERGEMTLWQVQKWWIVEGWKASPTWELKLLYLGTMDLVLIVTALRYRQKKQR